MNKLIITIQVSVENVRSNEIDPIMNELLRTIEYEADDSIIQRSRRSVHQETLDIKWEKK